MSPSEVVPLVSHIQTLGRVLSNDLEHQEAVVPSAEQALLDERLQGVDVGVATSSAASSVQPPAKTERRAEEALLLLGEEVVAPLDRRPERVLPGIGVAAALERSRRWREPLEDLLGESAFVRAAASSTASGSESRRRQSSAISSLGSSWERSQKRETASGSCSGGTSYSTSPCTRRSSRLVNEEGEVRAALKERGELGRRLDHLLQVVDEEQHLPLADVLGEAVLRAEGLGDRLRDERGVAQGGEPDPEDARLVLRDECRKPPRARAGSCPSRQGRSG